MNSTEIDVIVEDEVARVRAHVARVRHKIKELESRYPSTESADTQAAARA